MQREDMEEGGMRKALALFVFVCLGGFPGGVAGAERQRETVRTRR
jgi:hypothetical protein